MLNTKQRGLRKCTDLMWSEFEFFDWIPTVIRLQSVNDENWQVTRKSILKTTLKFKYDTAKMACGKQIF